MSSQSPRPLPHASPDELAPHSPTHTLDPFLPASAPCLLKGSHFILLIARQSIVRKEKKNGRNCLLIIGKALTLSNLNVCVCVCVYTYISGCVSERGKAAKGSGGCTESQVESRCQLESGKIGNQPVPLPTHFANMQSSHWEYLVPDEPAHQN